MNRATAFAVGCVRSWTRVYTWRLPAEVRAARREEIESDLWEGTHDSTMTDGEIVRQMMTRLALGIPDDLRWRVSQGAVPMLTSRRVFALGLIACAMTAGLLLRSGVDSDTPPLPLQPSPSAWIRESVPPPAPPPPPPSVPGRRPSASPVLRYAQTEYRVMSDGPPPVRIKEVRPVYPPIAFEYGVEGRVQVDAMITASGRVVRAEAHPDGPFYFVQSALTAINHWQFAAGDPTRAPARLTVQVNFVR